MRTACAIRRRRGRARPSGVPHWTVRAVGRGGSLKAVQAVLRCRDQRHQAPNQQPAFTNGGAATGSLDLTDEKEVLKRHTLLATRGRARRATRSRSTRRGELIRVRQFERSSWTSGYNSRRGARRDAVFAAHERLGCLGSRPPRAECYCSAVRSSGTARSPARRKDGMLYEQEVIIPPVRDAKGVTTYMMSRSNARSH